MHANVLNVVYRKLVVYATECDNYIEQNGPLQVAQPLLTTSGKLAPAIKAVMHVPGPNCNEEPFRDDPILAQQKLEESYYNCLKLADGTPGLHSIAFPAISAGFFGMNQWTVAHAAARAVKQFESDTASSPGELLRVELINLTLSMADVMSVVFREVFPVKTAINDQQQVIDQSQVTTPPVDEIQGDSQSQPAAADDWYEIERLLRHKRTKGVDYYLVKWKSSDPDSWEPRVNITDFALQQFYAAQRPKKRRRRN